MEWVSGDGVRDYEFPNNEGGAIWVRDFFGSGSPSPRTSDAPVVAYQRPSDVPLELKNEPRVFLTRRPAKDVIAPHFHEISQYQVVVEGKGRIGQHALEPLTVHYTDAYTPYGPIVTDDTLAFFTIRARSDNGGTHYMPKSKSRMPRRAGRALTVHAHVGAEGQPAGVQDLIPTTDDGVESKLVSLAAGEAQQPAGIQDRFYVVVAGSLVGDATTYGVYSCLYVREGEAAPTLTAGSDGAQVLVLQFGPAARLSV